MWGGQFTMAGGIAANNIARWDGTSWSALGSGVVYAAGGYTPGVYCLAVSGSTLYAGGAFDTAGGIAANDVASWNGTKWSALGSGTPVVNSMAVYGTNLYVGGTFYNANIGGVAGSTGLAYWNGTKWTGVPGLSFDNALENRAVLIYTLAEYRGSLYVGGVFLGPSGGYGFLSWDGTNYHAVSNWKTSSTSADTVIYDLVVAGDKL